jgi:hypothetical protein
MSQQIIKDQVSTMSVSFRRPSLEDPLASGMQKADPMLGIGP